ncbi:unnamed protein product [Acanthoscelides obtectus]|uniref:Uncharacterized protein n=1 Tax=Acanthoscelides obtectus TaxID=200917 RepID=A0A9P0MBG9_ACAOB|nr:unnamed protein product [Acanthoscelides obtectus]CAK1677627.1 hypothetical protein AOBTE_LOCUS31441 [Acanthoscelides obtectus]
MTLLFLEVFSRRLIYICMCSNQFSKHLFRSFADRSKTAFLNASTASSGDWITSDHAVCI